MKPDPYQFFADQTGVTPLMAVTILALLAAFVLIARSLVNQPDDDTRK